MTKENDVRREGAREAIKHFCKCYGRDISGIILYGSYAKGTETDRSDVDVIIVDEACERGYKVQEIVDSYHLQVIIANFNELLQILRDSPRASHPFLPVSFDMSVILFDRDGLCAYLKKIATEMMENGPQAVESSKVELVRIGLVNYLNDGTAKKYTGENKAESIMWAAKVIKLCEDLTLMSNKEWVHYNTNLKNITLRDKFPEIYLGLRDILSDFLADFCTQSFASKVKAFMSDHTNFSWKTKAPHHSSIF